MCAHAFRARHGTGAPRESARRTSQTVSVQMYHRFPILYARRTRTCGALALRSPGSGISQRAQPRQPESATDPEPPRRCVQPPPPRPLP
eukprot:2767165-Pleurochrysis_carterae.AAC.7